MNGRLIVFEGTDGSGKATQSRLLCEHLQRESIPYKNITFPRYGKPSAAMVQEYLDGNLGRRPGDVNAYAASLMFSMDRYASYKQDWGGYYARGGLLVTDRYTTSNAVHQCSKLPKEQWEDFLNWLFDFEYKKLGIPAPDRVIYLNVDPAVSQALMTARYSGDENKKDIHERDIAYLRHSREAAAYCAEKLGWETVDCCRDGQMRSIEDIHKDVMKLLENGIA